MHTVLLCGASGLVGRELCDYFDEKGIRFIGTYHSNMIDKPNFIQINFNSTQEIEDVIVTHNISCCVFLVVQRVTDKCENDWNHTKMVNIDYVNNASYVCDKHGVKFIHLSTDYVFDGNTQPNYPEDTKNPLQNYGISKLISECKVQANCKNYCIIRTPVLYGKNGDLKDNAVTLIAKNIMDVRFIAKTEDNYSLRRPLFVRDLCPFILDTITTNNFKGIYHFYNPHNCLTKYAICHKISNYLHVDMGLVVPQNDVPKGIASRPYDTMLRDNQYNIENYDFTDFDASIHQCFERFKIPPITEDVAFLIDLDGTLIDSSLVHYQSYKKVIESRNKPFFSVDVWETMISNGNVNDYLSDNFSKEDIEQIKREKIREFSKQSLRFTNNCEEFVQWLIRKNINMCIVTNTNYETVEIIKSKLPLLQKITNWIAREDYLHPKPSSECFEMAIKKYGFENKKIIGIEDTNVGYKSLKKVTDIICLYTDKSTEKFANNDCYIFNDYKRLQKFFT